MNKLKVTKRYFRGEKVRWIEWNGGDMAGT